MIPSDLPEVKASGYFPHPFLATGLGLVGAVLGAVLGAVVYGWLLGQGFYALALPGAMIGLGAGLASRRKIVVLGVVCAVLALIEGVLLEWQYAPFAADDSLSYFLLHLHKLKPVTLILILLGGVFGFWFGRGR